ncbi:MAG: butyrate kinase, partial [Bacteroidales bacterium]|nr:butyrate kinase [Bacteroidales bacterium]
MNKYRILAVNPGSTSTKIAVYENETNVFLKNIKHTSDELAEFKDIASQDNFRKSAILRELKEAGQDINTMDIVVGRGGLVKFIPSGVYQVNEAMIRDLHKSPMGEHASNLGGLIAHDLVQSMNNVKAYIADPVVVDELEDIARITGHPNFERVSIFHALNQKAIARKFASEIDAKYENLNLIVVHLGGGISVGAHLQGKVIDVNNALNGEGPFSPERTGTLPAWQLADYCLSGKAEKSVIKKMITGKGGFVAYLNTNDAYEVEMRAKEGDEKAQFISDAMAYQVAKEIGAMATVLKGIVDGILLTGGIAYNKQFCSFIEQMVGF